MFLTLPCHPFQDYVIPNFGFCALLILLATAQLFGLHLPYKRRNIHHATVEVDSLPDTGAVTLPGQLEQLEETGTTGRSDGLKDD